MVFNKDQCQTYREQFDLLQEDEGLSPQSRQLLLEHVDGCRPCQDWRNQMESIAEMSSAMPQFDVSEALTQRILSSVEADRKVAAPPETKLIWPLAVVAACLAMTIMPLDSIDGGVSWLIGLGGLWGLKLLLSTSPSPAETV